MSDKVTYIYHGNKDDFMPREIMMNGELVMYMPQHYKRTTTDENGDITVEFSLNPFENETT